MRRIEPVILGALLALPACIPNLDAAPQPAPAPRIAVQPDALEPAPQRAP